MSESLTSVDPARQAQAAAQAAADRAGVRIESLDRIEEINQASGLFKKVWSTPADQPLITTAMLRALSHSDNYVFAAYDGDEMVGASVGFLGWHGDSLHLHSHMTGVSTALQGRSVGFALKQHQRAWALTRGIGIVAWTFDPLVRRNAYFNITKLGASVTAYYPSFYGEMTDGINEKDESDRVLLEWHLESPHATEASVGRLKEPDVDALQRTGAALALSIGEDDLPVIERGDDDTLLACVPEDIVDLRRRDEALAHRWRLALRDVLGAALNDGYATTGMTRSGFYVLSRGS